MPEDPEQLTREYHELVLGEREKSRAEYGDDYELGKQPSFLFMRATSSLGRLSDFICGSPEQPDPIRGAEDALDELVVLGALLASQYELIARIRDELAELGEQPWNADA